MRTVFSENEISKYPLPFSSEVVLFCVLGGKRLNLMICSRCFVFLVHIGEDSVRRSGDVSRQCSILQGSVGPDRPVDTGR